MHFCSQPRTIELEYVTVRPWKQAVVLLAHSKPVLEIFVARYEETRNRERESLGPEQQFNVQSKTSAVRRRLPDWSMILSQISIYFDNYRCRCCAL
jgi:hypothetical protein